MKVAFYTLGCKVNQYESESMAEQFRDAGYETVDAHEYADVYVINTCTVTGLADRKSRQYMRRAKKINPNGVVVATGCYAQIASDTVAAIEEVDLVVGINEKHALLSHVQHLQEHRAGEAAEVFVHPREELTSFEDPGINRGMGSRTRAYMKIQEGCDRFCTYCVIPYARGPVRSRAKEEILKEAQGLIDAGYRELVLTGVNTALYEDLIGLLHELDALEGDFRIRLSSLEPTVIDKDYVKLLFSVKKLCHHLHLSMQSGSDRILSAMARNYTRQEYMDIVRELRVFDLDYGITTDLIVGFPGETEEDFADSLSAVSECEFGKVHAFRYSERPGTIAASMDHSVSPKIRKERVAVLAEAGAKASEAFLAKNMADGKVHRVLFEAGDADGEQTDSDFEAHWMSGYTDNYIKVYAKKDEAVLGEFANVKLTKVMRDGALGEVVKS